MTFLLAARQVSAFRPYAGSILIMLFGMLPACAQAFPFIAAGGGAVVLPYLLAMLSSLFKRKRSIVLSTTVLLGGYWLIYAPYDYVKDSYSYEENRLAGMMGERVHSIRNVRMTQPDPSMSVMYDELFQPNSRVFYVNDGGLTWRNGYEAEFILSNQRLVPKDTILVTGTGELGETIANATGVRWLRGGLLGVLQSYAGKHDRKNLHQIDCSKADACVRIGVMGVGFFMRFSGYPYKSKDRILDLHEIMMPGGGGLDILRGYQKLGKHVSIELYDFPSGSMDSGLQNFLRSKGIENTSVHYYDEQEKTTGNIDVLASRFGGSNKHLDLSDIDFLCKNDAAFVMAFDGRMNTGMLFPETLRENCKSVFIPVEGMLPHQIQSYLREHPLQEGRRYVGIYTDKSTAFYTKLLLGLMADEGYLVVGITSLDKEHIFIGDPLKTAVDNALTALSAMIADGRGKASSSWLMALFSALFGLSTLAFILADKKWIVVSSWIANLGIMLLLNFYSRYIPNDLSVDVFEVCLLICIAQLALVLVFPKKARHLSKFSGLLWLKKAGHRVPKSILIKRFNKRVFCRLFDHHVGPVIFRSCASGENLNADDSGRFESVVATSLKDYEKVIKAWHEMAMQGRKPSFVVQAYLDFEFSGVVSSTRTFNGSAAYVIESSSMREGVTGARDLGVTTQLLPREALTASKEPFHKEIIAIHRRLKGHFTAEFGVRDGRVTWLQIMRQKTILEDHRSFDEVGFKPSALQGLIDHSSAQCLEFLKQAVIGIDYLEHQGFLYERANMIGVWLRSIAPLTPWVIIKKVVDCTHRIIVTTHQGKPPECLALLLARIALVADQLVIVKGLADSGVADTMSERYAMTFGTSEMLLAAPLKMDQMLKQYLMQSADPASDRDVNLALALRDKAREVTQLAFASAWRSFPAERGNVEPYYHLDSSVVCPGTRGLGATVIVGREESARLRSEKDIILVLDRPDLSYLIHESSISVIRIPERPAYNSHFIQRCLSLGIRVELNPYPGKA